MVRLRGGRSQPGPRRINPSIVFFKEDTRSPDRAAIGGLAGSP